MALVSLRDLTGHLSDARKLVNEALDSDDDEPELDFGAIRKSMRSVLKLLEAASPEATASAADSVSGYTSGYAAGFRSASADQSMPTVADIFPGVRLAQRRW